MSDIAALISERLAVLAPTHFSLQDDSALHHGHLGNRLGGAHYTLEIASAAFANLPILHCHRLIYAQLNDLFPVPLHALCIKIVR